MHLTLKQETTWRATHSLRAQQAVFDRFRHEFNDERPHEALGQKRPADFYLASKRCLPDPPWRDFDYGETETHRIDHRGFLYWNERRVFISQTLAHQLVAIDWRDDTWRLRFANLQLGLLRPRRSRLDFEEQVLLMSMD